MNKLNSNLVWVTGGSRGIGESIVENLSLTPLTVRSISSSDVDFASSEALDLWLKNQDELPGVLILNAGINVPENFLVQDDEIFLKIFQVNFHANRQILRTILPHMQEFGVGHIVCISSLYASQARDGRSAYSASKSALDALMRSIALEFSSYGVLANSIAPGFVKTDLTLRNNSKEQLEDIESQIPIGRLAESYEIAKLVTFLATQNTYITGQTIRIDGGYSIR